MKLIYSLISILKFSPWLLYQTRIIYRKLFIRRKKPTFINEIFAISSCRSAVIKSKSQFYQDIFVLDFFDFKQNGTFIDIGASDGVSLSNTYLLEKYYNWNGILIEPNPYWHKPLTKNRTSPICTQAIFSKSGLELTFINHFLPELSKINNLSKKKLTSLSREISNLILVNTISLNDIFQTFDLPHQIDYLSIDIEGLEFEVLKTFDFEKYDIRVLTCEHNNNFSKKKIISLLTSKGYTEVHKHESDIESWFVK